MEQRVLVVEDDPKTSASIELYLRHAGFTSYAAATGDAGLEAARRVRPDLVVLDRMLPGMDGLELCRTLRAESNVPILMLTARSTLDDKVEGLDSGADDYLTKPFSPRELVARVEAILRRFEQSEEPRTPVVAGDVQIDRERHELRVGGRAVAVTAAELRILTILARAPGRVFTREELVRHAFGHDHEALDRTIDVHIKNLRRKIESDPSRPSRIVTVFGVGYKLVI